MSASPSTSKLMSNGLFTRLVKSTNNDGLLEEISPLTTLVEDNRDDRDGLSTVLTREDCRDDRDGLSTVLLTAETAKRLRSKLGLTKFTSVVRERERPDNDCYFKQWDEAIEEMRNNDAKRAREMSSSNACGMAKNKRLKKVEEMHPNVLAKILYNTPSNKVSKTSIRQPIFSPLPRRNSPMLLSPHGVASSVESATDRLHQSDTIELKFESCFHIQAMKNCVRDITKDTTSTIVDAIKNLNIVVNNVNHGDFFPSQYGYLDEERRNKIALLRFPAFKQGKGMPASAHTYTGLTMKLVSNPEENGRLYRRYEQTTGVDIAVDDGSLYKNPHVVKAKSFDVAKFPDGICDDPTVFFEPYIVQSIKGVPTNEGRNY